MPHAIEMKDGKLLTVFDVRDMLEAVSDYAGEELAQELGSYSIPMSRISVTTKRNLTDWIRRTNGWQTTTEVFCATFRKNCMRWTPC